MTLFNFNDLKEAFGSQLIDFAIRKEFSIDEVIIDSRKSGRGSLFFAFKGQNNDGHNFLNEVFSAGGEMAIIEDATYVTKFQNENFVVVKDCFAALYELAKYSRKRLNAKVIGITGSVGKTGTKEMLKTCLSEYGKVYATIGNYNNHFGLPLSLCNIGKEYEYVVLEMGMNHLNEINKLSDLAKPHIAIITTIAPAHIGNFNNEQEIALAKSEIFCGLNTEGFAIINGDNKYYEFLRNKAIERGIKSKNILAFGKSDFNQYQLIDIKYQSFNKAVVLVKTINNEKISYDISSSNYSTIFNSLMVVACLDLLKLNIKTGINKLSKIDLQKGRGNIIEIKINQKNITVIDDSYNANIASMKAGLDYLQNLKQLLNKKRSIAILGDMFELGDNSEAMHRELLLYSQQKTDFLVMVGSEMKNLSENVNKIPFKIYQNSNDASIDFKDIINDGDIILLKGSRSMKMENIIKNYVK